MSDLSIVHHRLTTPSIPAPNRTPRWRSRALAVAAAVVAALVVWLVAKTLIGVTFTIPVAGGTRTMAVGWVSVIVVTLSLTLAAWGLLAVLERFTPRARTIWTAIASAALLLSFAGPLFVAGAASVGTKVSLVLMHVVVAIVLISRLAWTFPSRSGMETISRQADNDRSHS